ncbi:MAG: ABC transporter permease subunit [bacterium]
MNQGLTTLFVTELRRQWTWISLIIPVAFAALAFLLLMPFGRPVKVYNVADHLITIYSTLLVPLTAVVFSVGLVSNDVKDGWLRTLLVRPISRQHYLLIKLAAVFCSTICVLIGSSAIALAPVLIKYITVPIEFDLLRVLAVLGVAVCQSMLLISILAFFSCWLPSLLNVVALMTWAIASATIDAYLRFQYWKVKWLQLLREYLFPGGFNDAFGVLASRTHVPYTELLWGFAALCAMLALAFWSITKIEIDKGSE